MTQPCVLITGATSGIGTATAKRFVQGGFHVFAHARDRARGEALVAKLGDATLAVSDLSADDGVRRLVEQVAQSGRTLTSLVNNAGGLAEARLTLGEVVDPTLTYKLNVFAAYELIQLCSKIDSLRSIVNISSIHAHATRGVDLPHYSGAKAALTQLTRTMAVALSPQIRVNSVSPGRTLTSSWGTLSAEDHQRLANDTLLERWVQPGDIAEAVWFLDQNQGCTGTDLLVDAGISLRH